MHESIFSGISSHRCAILHGQNDKKHSKTGFENRISVLNLKTGFPVFD